MLSRFEHITCSICGHSSFVELLTITALDRFEVAMGIQKENYERHWMQCEFCGVAANVHKAANIDRIRRAGTSYYHVDTQTGSVADKYRAVMSMTPERSDNHQRVIRIHEFLAKWRDKIGTASQSPRILDIGAGTGVFLSRFLDAVPDTRVHWSAVAVEPDPLAAEHLRSLNRFDVVEAPFVGQENLRDFNLCTLNKIVEHIERPSEFLTLVSRSISPLDGLLYIEVPDTITIHYRPASDNILGALHFHLYTFKSLSFLLESAELVPMTMMRIFEPSGKISLACFAAPPSVSDRLASRG